MHNIAVIVPVLNELPTLKNQYDHLKAIEARFCELIFVDGGSTDGSLPWLSEHFSRVLSSPSGRARQMNFGAQHAKAKTLLFLHVDTTLPLSTCAFELNEARWGFFFVKLTGEKLIYRLIASGINFRSRVFSVATGDQCLFFNRLHFLQYGGFPDQFLMEDIEMSRRNKKLNKAKIIEEPVLTSSRRWQKQGAIKTIILMWSIQLFYKLGVSPERLARWYGYKIKTEL